MGWVGKSGCFTARQLCKNVTAGVGGGGARMENIVFSFISSFIEVAFIILSIIILA
jgi:hypothetical protein